MGGKKVASYDTETKVWTLHKSAKVVEKDVEASMTEWLAKRESPDATSESD